MNLPNLQSPVIRTDKKWTISPTTQITAQDVQKCWSATKCSGKILSNRDYHNCCTKSSGKSWSDGYGGCKRC